MTRAAGQWTPCIPKNPGSALMRSIQAQQDFERGTLVPVLTDYNPPPMPVQFVFPHSRLLSPRVRHFMEEVEGPLKARLASGAT